jgi:hypothetical protein
MTTVSFSSARVTSYRLIAFVFTVAALASIICTLRIERQRTSELTTLASEDRRAVYEHALTTLRFTCLQTRDTDVVRYCSEQAHFLSHMRECDAACQAECRDQLPKPTR